MIDLSIATLTAVVLSPLILLTAILVRLRLGSPVIFSQTRIGKDNRVFRVHKFRTMTDKRDADGNLLPDDERLTPFGKLLRKLSLDELPQLWNVIRGDMSLVGPRPLLERYLPRYTPEQRRRHEVRPGITGWAQVNGRNEIDWDKKFELDVWYVDHCSLWVDIQIILKTVVCLITRRGISASEHVTMPEFMGMEASRSSTTDRPT